MSPIHSYDYLVSIQNYSPNKVIWLIFLLGFSITDISYSFNDTRILLMILLFLSVLDYCYYLTDIRYVIAIFVLALVYEPMAAHIETLLGCILFLPAFITEFCGSGRKKHLV
ncbi:fimbrial leader peptidase [Actinobacillus equuli]|nr:fimbrial leader peptidase [Actinobacillus equuli]